MTLPPGWSALSLPVVVPGLPRARAAAPGGRESSGVVLVGMAPRSAHRPALLSPELGAAGGSPASVRLGRLAAYRHDGLRWNGRPLTVYAAPTSAGVATVACLSPASSADCRRIAESLDVPGANGFPLGPDPAFAAAANRALKRPERSLAGSTAKAQADAARRIAGDFRTARARLGRVAAGPADAPLVASLTKPLSAAVEAYGELAAAADANGRRRYASAAKRAHAAELALRKAVRTSVYRDTLRTPHAQAIPSLRRPPAVEKPAPAPPVTPDTAGAPRPDAAADDSHADTPEGAALRLRLRAEAAAHTHRSRLRRRGLEQRAHRFHDLRRVREGDLLERLGVGHRQVDAGDATDRGVEVVERLLLDQRGEVRPHATVRPPMIRVMGMS